MNDNFNNKLQWNIIVQNLTYISFLTQTLPIVNNYKEKKELVEKGRSKIEEIYYNLPKAVREFITEATFQKVDGLLSFNTRVGSLLGFVNKSVGNKPKSNEDALGFIESGDFEQDKELLHLILADGLSLNSNSAAMAQLYVKSFILLSVLKVPVDIATKACEYLYSNPDYPYDQDYIDATKVDKSDITINATSISGNISQINEGEDLFKFEGRISNDCNLFILSRSGDLIVYNLGLHLPLDQRQRQVYRFNLFSLTIEQIDSIYNDAIPEVSSKNSMDILEIFSRDSILLFTTDGLFDKANKIGRYENIRLIIGTLEKLFHDLGSIEDLSRFLINELMKNATEFGYDDCSAMVVHPKQLQSD